jgi:hypothetical protein
MMRAVTPGEALERARMEVSRLSQLLAIGDKRATHEKLAYARRQLEALEDPDAAPEERTTGIAGALGKIAAAAVAVADRIIRPKRIKVLEADIKALTKGRETFAWNEYERTVRDVVSKATGLGLHDWTVTTIVNGLRGASAGRGYIRVTYEWLSGRTSMCFDTICRAYKALEDMRLAIVINTYRMGSSGKQIRGANLIIPQFPGDVPEPAPEVVSDQLLPLAQQTLAKVWLARLSGLFVRPHGLNSTPLRADHGTRPAPA